MNLSVEPHTKAVELRHRPGESSRVNVEIAVEGVTVVPVAADPRPGPGPWSGREARSV
jgi:hypothetical protein